MPESLYKVVCGQCGNVQPSISPHDKIIKSPVDKCQECNSFSWEETKEYQKFW